MQRMRRTQKQKRVYGRAMEARRCGPHMPRMCRETPRRGRAISMLRMPVLVPRNRISTAASSTTMQFLPRLPYLRTTQTVCVRKVATEYTASAWKNRNAERRICRACATKARGRWTCATCRQTLPKESFTTFAQSRPSGQDGTQVCDTCQQVAVVKPIAARATLR